MKEKAFKTEECSASEEISKEELNQLERLKDVEFPEPERESLAEKILERVRHFFEKYMAKYKGYDELKDFMSDENRLYDEDGKPTEEYMKKISEVEGFVSCTPIDDTLKSEMSEDQDALDGIFDFVSERKKFLEAFSEKQESEGKYFNADKFIEEYVNENCPVEQREDFMESLHIQAEQASLEALDNEQVSSLFKESINQQK